MVPTKSLTVRKRSMWSATGEYLLGGGDRFRSRYRFIEVSSCAAYVYLAWLLAVDIYYGILASPQVMLLLVPTALAAFVSADFSSGFVHWLADSYGTARTPFVGPKFVAPFREHHIDPMAITRHDFVEANGDNCLTTMILLVPAHLWLPTRHEPWAVILGLFLLLLASAVLLTSIAHGWAHMDEPPRIVRMLQRAGLILSKEHHAAHHVSPHKTHYCITTGWLNPLLDRLHFFRRLERVCDALGLQRAEHD